MPTIHDQLPHPDLLNGLPFPSGNDPFILRDEIPALNDGHTYCILPGFVDVHVHLREPGFSYKETIASGTAAAAHGGYTAVCAMPNLNPVPSDAKTLAPELAAIASGARVPVYPYGALTVDERGEALADLAGMAAHVCAFSDDGHGVQDAGLMREAMAEAHRLGKIVAAHCEDNSLLHGGYIHDGGYCKAHGHRGICSKSEWGPIERDLKLAAETGCAYHICHISTLESVQLIRDAKKSGVDVTCETGPHYLTLIDEDLQEDGRFKMNPPLRSRKDREALLEGLTDGTIDMIATDHAPHSQEEKSRGLAGSLMGVVGLETSFPVLYTQLVLRGVLSLQQLTNLMSSAPRNRFRLSGGYEQLDYSLWDLSASYRVNPDEFLSMGRATPFAGWPVQGKCLLTVCNGSAVWQASKGETA